MPLSYLSPTPEPLQPLASPGTQEPPEAYDEVRDELATHLERTAQAGTDLCRLLGMTSTWSTTKWEPAASPDTLLPTFRITVRGHVPDEETTDVIVRRLTQHAWNGAVLSREPIFRIDAHRGPASMTLTAEDNIVRLAVSDTPVRLTRTLATWILVGAFEDDEAS